MSANEIRKVDIAVCTWNRPALLADTLDSFSKLSVEPSVDLRVIIVDNNSTDTTPDVIQGFLDSEFAKNNSVSAATALAPNEVRMGRLPRLPLTVFERKGIAGHQSLARDLLTYCDLATDRQQSANDIVRKHQALTVYRVNRRNSALADALRPTPTFGVGCWVWACNSASTTPQGVKANTDTTVFKAKFALNRTGPYEVLAVGPCSSAETPERSPLWDTLLYLDLPSDRPGSDARRRVAIEPCKPCQPSRQQ